MVFAGAGGHAKELYCSMNYVGVAFYDDKSEEIDTFFQNKEILRSPEALKLYLKNSNEFILATGNPKVRQKMSGLFISSGGYLVSAISAAARVSKFSSIGTGANIMPNSYVAPDTSLGQGCLVNYGASIHHDSKLGDFCEIGPGARILGKVSIGHLAFIGAGAVILPGTKIGNHAVIGAGSVVNRDVGDHSLVVGVPARQVNKRVQ